MGAVSTERIEVTRWNAVVWLRVKFRGSAALVGILHQVCQEYELRSTIESEWCPEGTGK